MTGRATRCAPGRSRNDFTDGDRRTICPSVPDMFIYIHAHLYLRLFLLFFSLSLSRLSLFHASCLTWIERDVDGAAPICVVRCRQCRIACCASSLPSITATLSWERGRTRNKASWGLADLQRFVQHLTEEITAGPKEKGSPVQKEISE